MNAWMLEKRLSEQGLTEARWGAGQFDWFVLIPAGEFLMGAVSGDPNSQHNEKPAHSVVFREPFWIMKYPVTTDQFARMLDVNVEQHSNPVKLKSPDEYYANRPVGDINWREAQRWIEASTQKTGLAFRLPSEAEWEYACRAGTNSVFFWGDEESGDYAWSTDDSRYLACTVGLKKPNPFGLHDMMGNVMEWVEDDYHETFINAPTDGSAWIYPRRRLNLRVLRGAASISELSEMRVSVRSEKAFNTSFSYKGLNFSFGSVGRIGFRCAMNSK